MKRIPCARITCEVYQEISRTVLSALGSIGIRRPYIQSGRSIMLGERRGGLFSSGTTLLEDPIDIYSFTVPAERELAVMHRLIQAAMLDQEGRGSIYSEQAERISRDDECPGDEPPHIAAEPPHYPMIQHLVGISCIVQRGQSDIIVRSSLEMGICVPSVTFGIGAGLRDKLGLIRITIPAEKEVVNLVTTQHDAQGVLARLIEAGKFDQPGRGFIFTYPIARGLLNTRLYVGRHLSAASLGQIVAALDELKGTTAWRRKFTGTSDHARSKKREYMRGLVDLTLLCQEGRAFELSKVAMGAGASGATLSRLRRPVPDDTPPGKVVSPAREKLTMILPAALADPVAAALFGAGICDEGTAGEIFLRPCPEAHTYTGKK
ncbi:MAG TPA: hypothetical protein P5077_14035 [bacterium]|nr:hypothetical protein [bacterium]